MRTTRCRRWNPRASNSLPLSLYCLVTSVRYGRGLIQESFCNGRGLINSNLTCSCFSGFRGPDCSLRACPLGKAWTDFASTTNVAHADGVECSNMGVCDRVTGLCECRPGFAGQACDRLECPSACSGHGKCLSMAEAASEWDGRLLVRPKVRYSSVWDANILHGCVCDPGWIGHDCSQMECPKGDDPLTTGQKNEVIRVACQADSGSFIFSFRGVASPSIPFDASYGYVEKLLEDMDAITDVSVSMANDTSVCGQRQETVTEIEFLQDFGPLPAARVSPDGLRLGDGNATLDLESLFEILCPVCPSCSGGIYLIFGDETTASIETGATAWDLEVSLLSLETLASKSVYGNLTSLDVSMAGGSTLCDSIAEVTTSIRLRCPYGNLPSFELVNSVRDADGFPTNVTTISGKGDKENEYCANHGVCDFSTGTCLCDRNVTMFPDEWYWWESSDGYGGPGARPDCGYRRAVATTNISQGCPVGVVFANESYPTYHTMDKVFCSGKGTCDDATAGCLCHPDFYGGDCSQRRCPTGKAWFDEAYADDAAHAYGAECGAMGNCDHDTGECVCRDGWTGAACERLACDDDCSGNGVCLPMYRLAELRQTNGEADPIAYGITDLVRPWGTSVYASPSTWDFDMMYGCLCDSGARGAEDGDMLDAEASRPRVGKRGYVSGVYTDNAMLPGWSGYKCSQRTCPTGDDPRTASDVFEVQTVTCTLSAGSFAITFRGATTQDVQANATAASVASAMERVETIGVVDVSYTSGDVACNASWAPGEGIQVTFLTELGALPLMTTSPPFLVESTRVGTKESAECAGTGICDFDTGICTCLDGWASSNGDGGTGDRGDCGYRYEFCTDKTHESFTLEEAFALLQAAEQ